MYRPLSKSILLLMLLVLAGSFVQKEWTLIGEAGLHGFFRTEPAPGWKYFTWHRWFSGEFQQEMSKRVEDHIGFRNTLFRMHNEFDYRLFGITHAKGFIRAKKGYLIEEDYIHEYTGRYFIGKKTIDYKLGKLQQVAEKLRESGIRFLLVFEPGKASFYPEYIPDRYHPERGTLSNYAYITRRVQQLGIPSMDLNRYFLSMKDTAAYALFPRYGMHWSIYGAFLAADTLRKHLESASGKKLPDVRITGIEISNHPRWTDQDIGELLNLVFPLPPDTLAYPLLSFDSSGGRQLAVLVIADSYYVNIIHDVTRHLFRKHEYWYYNSKLYPHIVNEDNPVYVDKADLKKKFREFDAVLLMVSEINLHCGFWNFADEAYQAFYPGHQDPPWYPEQNKILNDRDWFNFMVTKARKNHMTTEEAIIRDAKYIYHTKNP